MFNWIKLGQIFCPDDNSLPWMASHASNPFPLFIDDHVLRIYFSCRDTQNKSSIGFVDVDCRGFEILRVSSHPVIGPGTVGLFDDSGVSLGCIVRNQDHYLLYYVGWNLRVTVPWQNSIGLAVGDYQLNFSKHSLAPVLDRHPVDPYSISYPFVLYDEKKFKMWYGTNLSWGTEQTDMRHVIKYAESPDGISWTRKNVVAIGHQHENEYAISKPFVMKIEDQFHMWYCYRGSGPISNYQIGYATSFDGMEWNRKDDKAGIHVSESGWDSEMICYPSLFKYQDKLYMLYNGNGYGKTGFGIAVAERF